MQLSDKKKMGGAAVAALALVAVLAAGISAYLALRGNGGSGAGLPAGAKDLGRYKPPAPSAVVTPPHNQYPQESH